MSIRVLLPLLLLLMSSLGVAGPSQVVGTVRIVNPNAYDVIVLSQSHNAFGASIWNATVVIKAKHFVELPNVPAGVLLGFKRADKQSVTWPPITIYYPRPNEAFYVYHIPIK